MANKIGVISRPQFDTTVFEKGKAIHFKLKGTTKGFVLRDEDGIIVDASPLSLKIAFFNKRDNDMDYNTITIGQVVNEEAEITLLGEVLCK